MQLGNVFHNVLSMVDVVGIVELVNTARVVVIQLLIALKLWSQVPQMCSHEVIQHVIYDIMNLHAA